MKKFFLVLFGFWFFLAVVAPIGGVALNNSVEDFPSNFYPHDVMALEKFDGFGFRTVEYRFYPDGEIALEWLPFGGTKQIVFTGKSDVFAKSPNNAPLGEISKIEVGELSLKRGCLLENAAAKKRAEEILRIGRTRYNRARNKYFERYSVDKLRLDLNHENAR